MLGWGSSLVETFATSMLPDEAERDTPHFSHEVGIETDILPGRLECLDMPELEVALALTATARSPSLYWWLVLKVLRLHRLSPLRGSQLWCYLTVDMPLTFY